MGITSTDLALTTSRIGCARLGAARLGFIPDDVDATGVYNWREIKPPTTTWRLITEGCVCGKRPIAAFTAGAEVAGLVAFTNTTIGGRAPLTYLWDFGDGVGTSTDENPSYTYSANGTYPVTLTVTDSNGLSDSVTNSVTITSIVILEAHFSWESNFNKVVFTDTSTGSPTEWAWDFGDTQTSDEQNPIHIYAIQGVYTVTLTIIGPGGTDDVTTSVDCTPDSNSGSI